MADENVNLFEGIKFDLSKLSAVSLPTSLAQAVTIPSAPIKMPDTVTPLGSMDSFNAGVEKAAGGLPSSLTHALPVAVTAGRLGMVNDTIAVGQHLIQGRLSDATIEFGGVAGQTLGAGAGYSFANTLIPTALGSSPLGVIVKLGAATAGAYFGSNGGKDLTAELINTTPPLASGQSVQQVATIGDQRYGLGTTVDGKLDWYRIDTYAGDTRTTFGTQSGTLVPLSTSERLALTDQFAKSTMSPDGYATYQRMVKDVQTQGDISENINQRIQPVGTVVIDPNANTPLTPTQVIQKVADGFSPVGWEPLNQSIPSSNGGTHSWSTLPDGNVVRVEQKGGSVTVTTYAKGSTTPAYERQTVSGDNNGVSGVISDTLLKPDANGQMVVDKSKLGGFLDESSIPTSKPTLFNPATALGNSTADHTITVFPGDTVTSIATRWGMEPKQYEAYLREEYGSNADLNSIIAGRKLPLPPEVYERTMGGVNGLDLPLPPATAGDATGKPVVVETSAEESTTPTTSTATTPANTSSEQNQPVALVPTAQPATENVAPVASTANATSTSNATTDSQTTITAPAGLTPAELAELNTIGGGLGVVSSIFSLRNWDKMDDLGHLGAVVGTYNAFANLGQSGGSTVPSAMGQVGAGIGLVTALNSGDSLSIATSGAAFYNSFYSGTSSAIPVPVIGFLGMANAMQHDDPWGAAASAASFIPGYGPIISFAITMVGMMFRDDHIPPPPPPPMGEVSFTWGADGHVTTNLQNNVSGGGAVASSVGGNLVGAVQGTLDAHNTQVSLNIAKNEARTPATTTDTTATTTATTTTTAPFTGLDITPMGIDPSRLPTVRYEYGRVWMDIRQPDGSIKTEEIKPETAGQRMLQVADQSGAVVPLWQAQTSQAHAQTASQASVQNNMLYASPTSHDSNSAHPAPAPASTSASTPPRFVYDVSGRAAESADHKTQNYGTLVVHLRSGNAAAIQQTLDEAEAAHAEAQANYDKTHGITPEQRAQAQAAAQEANPDGHANGTHTVYRNIDNDEFLESGQWINNTDSNGAAQGVLVIDRNNDGVIETTDILNLGGNTGQAAWTVQTDGAQQRNNVAWMDANADGVLDAHDPAFAAIRIWVDVNGDSKVDAGEMHGLQTIHLTQIDFKSGEVHYSDGQKDSLTTQTLTADTSGVKAVAFSEVGADGKLVAVKDAGTVIVHEGYEGRVWVDGKGKQLEAGAIGGHWEDKRTISTDHIAKRTGDWEKTADRDLHRHGGGNVAGAPTATTASLIGSTGPVLGKENVITYTTMDVGDERFSSDAPAQLNQATGSNTTTTKTITLSAGDARIRSLTPQENAKALAFVPGSAMASAGADSGNTLHLPEDSLFGGAGWTGALTAVAVGTVQTTAFAKPDPDDHGFAWQTAQPNGDADQATAPANQTASLISSTGSSTPTPATTIDLSNFTTVRQVHLGVRHTAAPLPAATNVPLYTADGIPPQDNQPTRYTRYPAYVRGPYDDSVNTPQGTSQGVVDTTPIPKAIAPRGPATTPASDALPSADAPAPSAANPSTTVTVTTATTLAPAVSTTTTTTTPTAAATQAPIDTTPTPPAPLSATAGDDHLSDPQEDAVLRVSVSTLLGNDTNAVGISAVGNASHGTVVLSGNEVVFTPEADYHGPASFAYVVTGQDGGKAAGVASFDITGVNDVPVVLGEAITGTEDATLLISQAALLANDTDADIATDHQTLTISTVSNANHGTVSITGGGSIQFIPEANYNGTAGFDYVVSDGAGGTATATVQVQVSSVNDAPVASGETISSKEDETITITAGALLANEVDPDNPTGPGNAGLQIARVAAGTGGTVSLNGSGDVVFTPTANYSGTANFTYWVKDPGGLESNAATVTVNVSNVNDAPYAQGESLSGASEDATFTIGSGTLLANDGDPDEPNSNLGIVLGSSSNGSVSMDGHGNVVFTPDANYNGGASFNYQVRDSGGLLSPTVTAQFNVASVNDNPLGVDEQFDNLGKFTHLECHLQHLGLDQLLSNDKDVDGDALTVSGVRNVNNGTAVITNGSVVFTSTSGYKGQATFEYQVDDGHGGQTWATAYVTVKEPPNMYPYMTPNSFARTVSGPTVIYNVGMSFADDGDTTALTVQYLGGTYTLRNTTNLGETQNYALSAPNYSRNDFSFTVANQQNVQGSYVPVGFETTWQVTDDRGLVNIWHYSYSDANGSHSSMNVKEGTYYAPPVVLALHGDAPHYITTYDSNVRFDLNGDGVADQVAWAAPGSGVLGIDLNGDHQISNASEFAFAQYVPGAQTDMQGLRAFDTNHNGLLDAGDAQWGKFGVWEDKDRDGQTQAGEYLTMDALGIASIDLTTHAPTNASKAGATSDVVADVVVVGESVFTRTDGSTGQVDDAMFAYTPAQPAPIAPHSHEAEIMRMALLFNQMCNTAVDGPYGDHAALGFVPMQHEAHWADAVVAVPQQVLVDA